MIKPNSFFVKFRAEKTGLGDIAQLLLIEQYENKRSIIKANLTNWLAIRCTYVITGNGEQAVHVRMCISDCKQWYLSEVSMANESWCLIAQ